MRLVHEDNREKVERWMHKKRLTKIATLEEFDKQNLLSDRRMLADEYIIEGKYQIATGQEKLGIDYANRAIRIYQECEAHDDEADVYYALALAYVQINRHDVSQEYIRKAKELSN